MEYENIFSNLEKIENLEGLKINKYFIKKLQEEGISLKQTDKPFDQQYHINIQLLKRLFTKHHIFQVNGHSGNQNFKIYFVLSILPNKEVKFDLFDFREKDKIEHLDENRHKFLDHTVESLQSRLRIYNDTKILLKKFKRLLGRIL